MKGETAYFKMIQNIDPLQRNAYKCPEDLESSPMEPPEAYADAGIAPVRYDEMPRALQRLMDEHKECLAAIEEFDATLTRFKESDWRLNRQFQDAFRKFFVFFDKEIILHNTKEEKLLFPRLQRYFLDSGEHGTGEHPLSAIDVLEDDHAQFMQSGALLFNFLGLAPRLPDKASSVIVFKHAHELGKELVESLRLHIYREDHTLFPLARNYLSAAEFEELYRSMEEYE